MRKFLKENWYKLSVLILLLLICNILSEIKDNTFYTADMVDSSATRIINSSTDYLNEIQRNTENTWQILDDR